MTGLDGMAKDQGKYRCYTDGAVDTALAIVYPQ